MILQVAALATINKQCSCDWCFVYGCANINELKFHKALSIMLNLKEAIRNVSVD